MDTFPLQAPHFFVGTSLDLLREVPYALLVEVSQLAKANGSAHAYNGLMVSVQKLQWVKSAALRAIEIDRTLIGQPIDTHLLSDSVGQAEHARSVFEIVSYGKAVADALAHFLNEKWALGHKERACDFKWQVFRDAAARLDPSLNDLLSQQSDWLNKDSQCIESLPATRDEWIHRGVPDTALVWPPTEVGVLPIRRSLTSASSGRPQADAANYMSTVEFANLHFQNLQNLLLCILRMAIAEERKLAPDLVVHGAESPPASLFLTLITQGREWEGVRLGPYTASAYC